MENRSVQMTASTSVLPRWQHQSVSQAESSASKSLWKLQKKIKNLKWVILLHGLPNKISKLGTQVEVMYQCLSLHKFPFPISLVYCYRIFCFVILFCWWHEISNSSLNFECKISRKQCFLKRAKPPWNRRAMICSFPFWPDEYKAFCFPTWRYLKSSIHIHTLPCNLLHTARI